MSGRRKVTERTVGGKRLPVFKSDEEAEAFLEQDLTDYIWAGNFAPFPFEFRPKKNNEDRPKRPARTKPRRRQASR